MREWEGSRGDQREFGGGKTVQIILYEKFQINIFLKRTFASRIDH